MMPYFEKRDSTGHNKSISMSMDARESKMTQNNETDQSPKEVNDPSFNPVQWFKNTNKKVANQLNNRDHPADSEVSGGRGSLDCGSPAFGKSLRAHLSTISEKTDSLQGASFKFGGRGALLGRTVKTPAGIKGFNFVRNSFQTNAMNQTAQNKNSPQNKHSNMRQLKSQHVQSRLHQPVITNGQTGSLIDDNKTVAVKLRVKFDDKR